MSNAKRQALFQKRHPGYDTRRKARQRAMAKRASEMAKAEWLAATSEPLALPAPAAAEIAPRPVLMLPEPAEQIVLPGLNATGRTLQAVAAEARDPDPQLPLFPAMRPAA